MIEPAPTPSAATTPVTPTPPPPQPTVAPAPTQTPPAKKKSSCCLIIFLIGLAVLVGLLVLLVALGAKPYAKLSYNIGSEKKTLFDTTESPTSTATREEETTPAETSDSKYYNTDDTSSFPTAPSGFSWVRCTNMSSAYLMPNGWYKKEESDDPASSACFISREEIVGAEDQFSVGLSVNLNGNMRQKTGQEASEYAYDYMQNLTDQYETTTPSKLELGSGIQGWWTIMQTDALKQYIATIGSDIGDQFYLIGFESPLSEWDTNWNQFGQTIINNMILNVQ